MLPWTIALRFGATWNLPVAFSSDFQGVPIEAPRETSKTVRIRSIGKDWKDWTGRTGFSNLAPEGLEGLERLNGLEGLAGLE